MLHLEFAKGELTKKKSFRPMLIAFTKDELVVVQEIALAKNSRQARFISEIALHALNAIGYILMMETWIAKMKKGEKLIRPRDHPKRRDALFIHGQLRDEFGSVTQYFEKQNDEIKFQESIYSSTPIEGKLVFKLPKR